MQISMDGVSVYIGMPIYGQIVAHTAMSLINTVHASALRGFNAEVAMHQRGIVTWARDQVLNGFLKSDKSKLLWVDSDVIWTSDDFFKMVALSTQRDVVCASYPAKKEGPLDFQIFRETAEAQALDELGLVKIAGVGLGFTIMDRKVIEEVIKTKPIIIDDGHEMYEVFRTAITPQRQKQGEDMCFFEDVRNAGFDIWLDPSVELGHAGQKIWKGRALDSFTRA